MLDRIESFSDQIESALSIINKADLGLSIPEIKNVLVLGMGGSAISGDLVSALVADNCKLPITVHRSYDLPAWADRQTLVIASSFSGNTEEVLSGWNRASVIASPRFAITTGGKLATMAEPTQLIQFEYSSQPRAALGFSFTLLLVLLGRLGLISTLTDELTTAVRSLKSADPEPSKVTRSLVKHLEGGIPVILAAEHLVPVARRWSTQINENSKSWAFWNEYPELDHNLIVGLHQPISGSESNNLRVINLYSYHYHPQIKRRISITTELMRAAGIPVFDFSPDKRAGPLIEMLQTIAKGDYLSYYLAQSYKVDPTPVPEIEILKVRLANKIEQTID